MEPYWDLAKRKKNIEIVHVFWLDHLLKFNLDLGLKYLWKKKKAWQLWKITDLHKVILALIRVPQRGRRLGLVNVQSFYSI